MISRKFLSLLFLFCLHILFAIAQNISPSATLLGQDGKKRTITVAVPFLNISPDARGAALGDTGVSTSPDLHSTYWNPAKLAMLKMNFGVALSYTPWLPKITNDMSLSYLTFIKRITKTQVIAANFRYFNLGNVDLKDNVGSDLGVLNPREFAISGTYSQILGPHISIGSNIRFIYSNLFGNIGTNSGDASPGVGFSIDMALYHDIPFEISNRKFKYSWGINISNLGTKISYNNARNQDFIPTNLRLGNSINYEIDIHNVLTFTYEVNKLLVPTPPIYQTDDNGVIAVNANGEPIIAKGENPNRDFFSGVFGSLFDAPDGLSEELKEFNHHFSLAYNYKQVFAFRTGYFFEHADKGDRKYLSIGAGFKFNKFGLDVAYLVPGQRNHPLAETIRFTVNWKFVDLMDGM